MIDVVRSSEQPEPGTTCVYLRGGKTLVHPPRQRVERPQQPVSAPSDVWSSPDSSPAAQPIHPSAGSSFGGWPAEKPPLLIPSASRPVSRRAASAPHGIALAAGAAVAVVGGLAWAGVVLVTHYDIGFLAYFVGAATGGTVFRISGAPVRGLPRFVTGLLAAGGILVGKYVIFVHEVKHSFGSALAQHGISVGYLDTRMMSIFIHHFSTIVRPIYALWILIALVAALVSVAGGRTRPGQRRVRSAQA